MPSNKKKAKKLQNKNGLTYSSSASSFSGYLTAADWTSMTTTTSDYTTYTTYSTNGTYTYGDTYTASSGTTLTITPSYTWTTTPATFVDTTGTISYGPIKVQMLFENELIEITEKGEVLVDGKLELNPTKIGRALLQALEKYRQDDLNDPKDFFNKD